VKFVRIFKSLSDNPDMVEVFRKFNDGLMPLCEYHDNILRGDSPLSVAERGLIAAFVSGIDACRFCFGAQQAIAESHGADPGLLEKLLVDPASSGIDENLLPLLAYVQKLTLTPSAAMDESRRARLATARDDPAFCRDFARMVLEES
jgi:AhpD family alkylhydroperoxidase